MAHLVAFIIIGAIKLVKWTLFKTRLIIAALPVAAVLIFFKDWYEANIQLADGIGLTLIFGIAASWIVTLSDISRLKSTIGNWSWIGHMTVTEIQLYWPKGNIESEASTVENTR